MNYKIKFAIIGGGWRTEFYLRIAEACPERFEIAGVVVRDEAKRHAIEKAWDVRGYATLEELLHSETPSFVVVSVSWASCPVILEQLAERGIPALSETPPAPDLEALLKLNSRLGELEARVQVAEQYLFQPLHAARQACIESGRLGQVSQVQVSAAHGYHGISLMRQWLGAGHEPAVIRAFTFESPLTAGPNRMGAPASEQTVVSKQTIASLQFASGRLGIFDFTGDQYFSWIRSQRVLIRGERGEIVNETMTYLLDYLTPIETPLLRKDAGQNGNLEGYYHKGILAGEQWVYQNPLAPARLTDDEIAVATCLLRMDEYVRTGKPFYSLADASQDHYLNLLIQQAATGGETVTSVLQPWSEKA
ncbi:Gfo/Idh/MocA family protein [Paenibacillus sp. UNC451MF]|uniref:Gfo/Idh/MocA family protein n=1 Tax=Paenibacillus sp. UNC451MF TaxID=1449063 RepID=UPI00048BA6CD|nr:Gfo/Idh/MocA family oxidoreductase [Paenibacillus sp. UNC451MF]